MTQRTYLVTGPTRGLGFELVRNLAAHRPAPKLVLVGRRGPPLQAASDEATARGARDVVVVPCDLSSLAQVRAASEQILGQIEGGIDGVVTNAALQMSNATSVTQDGIETTFAVGIVSHHLLLRTVQPVLNPNAHLVLVGSGTHYGDFPARLLVPGPKWDDVTSLLRPSAAPDAASVTAGRRTYATSKLAVNYLCHEWHRRYGSAIRVNVYDPGLMPGTGLARDASRVQQMAWRRVLPALRVLRGVTSPAHSGACLAALLSGDAFADARNTYFEIGRIKAPSDESNDEVRERQLFDALDARISEVRIPEDPLSS